MLRTITLAAAAALLATAASAQSITISTRDKTPEQVKAAVVKAADKLCYRQTVGASFPIDAQQQCVANTVRKTLQQAPDLGLTYAQGQQQDRGF
jgi:(p)ppGpp synthase/HD superfamily hydrolase